MLLNHPATTATATTAILFRCHHQHSCLSPHLSHSLTFSPGVSSSSLSKPLTTSANPVSPSFKCFISSKATRYGTVDYENRRSVPWIFIFKRLSSIPDTEIGADSVLDQFEKEGKKISKFCLYRVVQELRKFKRYKVALEVYEWMKSRPEKFWMSISDLAVKLDLISKVHGVSTAEDYFRNLGNHLKDGRVCGSLLNAYARSKMKEKAESLFATMKEEGFVSHALTCNVMMTLYLDIKEYDKVETIVSEMREKNIPLDLYSYNIWLSSLGSQNSLEKMEQVFELMKIDTSIDLGWSTFSTMATMYIKMGHFDKAGECLKQMELMIEGHGRVPFQFLISLYGNLGKTGDVHRVWKAYKSKFISISNMGYRGVITSLVKCGDVEGAEDIYDEWLSANSPPFDPRIGNILLACYVRNQETEKADVFFNQMVAMGGKPNSRTWEILAEYYMMSGGRVSEALACLKDAVLANESKRWKPRHAIVSSILGHCEGEGDVASKETLLEVLKQTGGLGDEMEKDDYIDE
ncbi:unnamed protein product [Cuscuta europaea]|uniref:Pentatricopeptide repeat-containing protein n=1 Tax=Cuscuta europaea TaxID=41803 RepID=A0A9P0ZE68_CUSEU|nr:unnamed protein product [Cuscuta europaea]